ncbi:M15 family metallopeptidase [Bacillus sp. 7884-1]|uniref:M15 family metallopeptidase n=1 Tax=Bacillus sp. 7884-1 TaxID=2021693 RepID=UPI000BA68208|nr:M15 family metallopeptidase [Bacillus sp. 7884-1]PAE38033.1 peptidase M15 [Bacillus sp. 7884-1]
MVKKNVRVWFVFLFLIAVVGCGRESNESNLSKNMQSKKNESLTPLVNVPHSNQAQITKASYTTQERTPDGKVVTTTKYPESIAVFVNKKIYLPHTYIPTDLVFPKVSFIFKEYIDKRKMRKEAAIALEKMFAAAKKEGIYLSGASGYRSYATQASVFNYYVKRDGYEKARTYSAIPGTSEHQTGLAIDVSGSNGYCAVSSCFADTKEAKWLDKNSANFGYIIRYPKGKEYITGYKYEPWHIRYVGTGISKDMKARGLTLEEYFGIFPVLK